MLSLVSTIFDLVKNGKSTVDEIMNDPKVKEESDALVKVIETEQKHGNAYTKAARPTAIYLCLFIMFNDFVLREYINLFVEPGNEIPVLLTEAKFKMLMGFLTALGLARSVLDKQGNWLQRLFNRSK